ncbi:MAG: hypothetical protein PVH18_04455, partial [Chloroflexota bacterium]|jgi:N-acetylglutamate synthase-like GNAT family acetyltransferase
MTEAHFDIAWNRLQRRLSADELPTVAPAWSSTNESAAEDGDGGHAEGQRNAKLESAKAEPVRQPTPRDFEQFGPDISVRRAQPDDVEAMTKLVEHATRGILVVEATQLFADLSERGYLIGQQGQEINALGGWKAENLVATVDCLYVYPPEALTVTGAAILHEIELTANELICEVIIALPGDLSAVGARQLLLDRGFRLVDPKTLPQAWRSALESDEQEDTAVMLKVLRDTRQVRVRTLKE